MKSKKVFKTTEDAPIIAMPTASAGIQSIKDLLHKSGLGDRKIYSTSSLESAKELNIKWCWYWTITTNGSTILS